jgi:hypothetical protein
MPTMDRSFECFSRPMDEISALGLWAHGKTGRVERWRGGLGVAYLCPALSFAGASLAAPCSVSTLPLIEPGVRN